jgi:hypothetical protein
MIRARRRTAPGPARAPIHVQSRPFPGAEASTAPDLVETATTALSEARGALANAHGPGCQCSVWCRNAWEYFDHAIGPCAVCGEPCRSYDEDGVMRHPNCPVEAP